MQDPSEEVRYSVMGQALADVRKVLCLWSCIFLFLITLKVTFSKFTLGAEHNIWTLRLGLWQCGKVKYCKQFIVIKHDSGDGPNMTHIGLGQALVTFGEQVLTFQTLGKAFSGTST